MQIGKDSVVTLAYEVRDTDDNLIDAGEHPLVYIHGGHGGIFERLEYELQGKEVGDRLQVKLTPDQAFGEYDASLVNVESRNLFPEDISVGMQFERAGEEEDEDILYTITDIAGDKVVVDGNHPLAGKALIFECQVTEVRAATAEEIAHGHVHAHDHDHDHGGHHHH